MRQLKREVKIGNVTIGGNNPIAVQTMLNVPVEDIEGNVAQAKRCEAAGCQILRVTCPSAADAKCIEAVKNAVNIPIVADIHFDYKAALACADVGVDKIRINPGNIGDDDRVKAVVQACQQKNIPIRIGVNGGSLEKHILAKYGAPVPEAMVESALYHVRLLEKFDFNNIVISIKNSNVPRMMEAYRQLSAVTDYPLHVGVTEAGTYQMGLLKSGMGIGGMLLEGIGDTIRVSLAAEPEKEVEAGYNILRAVGFPVAGPEVITCPTCGRTLLTDTSPLVAVETPGTGQGVRLTLDADLQRACEGLATLYLPRGCIVVMDTATGEVLASVSMPSFDPQNVAASIAANDTSLLNRPLRAFSAGSVFKVVLAAAAYESGLDWYTHDCTGEVEVAGQTHRCALGRAHGVVNLRGALEQSCNTYFIELGRLLGAQRIRKMAETLGFGTATQLAPGLQCASGTLPDAAALENPGELATFSFGQGALTVTPLQITAMMNTVANGGMYRTPAFVQGIVDAEGTLTGQTRAADTRTVFDAATARVLRSMLASVVSEGIGSEAQPKTGTAGGKTGTAQTGQYDENGEELLNYWFSGFYPADDPRYTITVLQDGILKPETSSAAIFAKVTEILAVWENS